MILLGLKGGNKDKWLLTHCSNSHDHMLTGVFIGQAESLGKISSFLLMCRTFHSPYVALFCFPSSWKLQPHLYGKWQWLSLNLIPPKHETYLYTI